MIEYTLDFVPHVQFAWIPAALAAVGSIFSTLMTNKANKDASREAFEREKDYSQWLLGNQTQQHVQDARKAGLNPAFMNGSQLGSTPSPPSYKPPQYNAPDLTNAFMFEKQVSDISLQNAQKTDLLQGAESKRLDNERQKIENARMIAEDKNVSQYLQENQIDFENLESWFETHPNELPDSVSLGSVGAKGALDAKQDIANYERILQDVEINDVRNKLEKLVTSGQIQDSKIVRALENMPLYQYRKLVSDTRNVLANTENLKKSGKLLDIEAVTAQLEQDIARDNNISQYIDKMFDGEFEVKDLAKVLVMAFLGSVTNIGSVSTGVKNMRKAPTPVTTHNHNTYVNTGK